MLHALFVCEHNSARSQMVEAFVKHLGVENFAVQSCGFEAGIRAIRDQIKAQVEAFISRYHEQGLKMFL